MDGPARLLNQSLASKRSLRRNSKASPRNALAPDFVSRLTTPPERAAELRSVDAGMHLHLVERIDVRKDGHRVEPHLVVVEAVEQEVVVAIALTVGRKRRRLAPAERTRAVDVLARDAAHDTGQRPRQLDEIPRIEWQPLDLIADQRRAQVRGRPLHQRVVGLDRDDVGDVSNLERGIDPDFLIDLELDAGNQRRLEASCLKSKRVDAGCQERGRVIAVGRSWQPFD